jgi:hypothetical protein
MPAELVRDEAIPQLAAQIDSPAVLGVLLRLRQDGFIQDSDEVDEELALLLKRLVVLGLVDPAYAGPTAEKPFLWVGNSNGERVVRHFESMYGSRVKVHPRARTALESLSREDQQAVWAAVAVLLLRTPDAWPSEQAVRLSPDKPVYLLEVSPRWRAFIRLLDENEIELFDIVLEETLRLFLERYYAGSGVA